MTLTIHGSRASYPFHSPANARFGGNTACARLITNSRAIILDAGSGLLQYLRDSLAGTNKTDSSPKDIDILLGHLHLDHIIGLPMFAPLFLSGNRIRIYTKSRGSSPLADQVFGVFRPPYWPVDLSCLNKAELVEIYDGVPFKLADGTYVTPYPANHSDGAQVFRVDGDKSVVYLSDYEIEAGSPISPSLAGFCRDADAVILDASYLPEDYPARRGWGHSTYEAGMSLAEACACKRMIFTHWSQDYSDETLDMISALIARLQPGNSITEFHMAYDGMEMTL